MKAIIIVPGLVKFLPYISVYEKLFRSQNVDFKIFQWDRINNTKNIDNCIYSNGYAFSNSKIKRIISYYHYIKWVYYKIKCEQPTLIVIATIAPAVCLLPILYNLKGKFILDIRDYSPLAKICKPLIKKAVSWSHFTLISSKGFLKWLPEESYLPIYNLGIKTDISINSILVSEVRNNTTIKVVTIGFLRDFKENAFMIDSLGNKEGIDLIFHGDGIVLNKLIAYTNLKKYRNIYFTGPFDKDNEPELYANADIINILMPAGMDGSTLLSNRFINSITYHKPMIVTKGSYQAELVEKYGLGFSIGKNDNVYKILNNYLKNYNSIDFSNNCSSFLCSIVKEQNETIVELLKFIDSLKDQ